MSALGVVLRAGPLCTVQDLGRIDGSRVGLAPGGAMDQRAFLWANRLLGNDPAAPALEVSLGGLSVQFDAPTVVALTGADCAADLDGEAVGAWGTTRVRSGQTLSLGFSPEGLRAYLAFPGGLDVPSVFGSTSTVLREGLPGLLGRPLENGESLGWLDPGRAVPKRHVPANQIPPRRDLTELPFLPGYEWEAFSAEDRLRLMETDWTVDVSSDRTACRLVGPSLTSGPKELDSVPLVDGTVQVTGDGTPLVFMRDRPTIGGYPKLGTVDPLSLDLLAQARPGSPVRFIPGDRARMRAGLVQREDFFELEEGA